MRDIILQKLDELERKHSIAILYACESGSRAWGFASTDSDYDVRFIYVHPLSYYLELNQQRDVIELPINGLLDINGWELRKALRLFNKSNGALLEWLQSPIVYKLNEHFYREIMALLPGYFSPRALMHHYLSMTRTIMVSDLAKDEVKLKKYFYVLRPVLACRWIADRNEAPPMEFGKLRALLDEPLQAVVDELLEKKSSVDEGFMIRQIPSLHNFIVREMNYCEERVPVASTTDSESLGKLFKSYLL